MLYAQELLCEDQQMGANASSPRLGVEGGDTRALAKKKGSTKIKIDPLANESSPAATSPSSDGGRWGRPINRRSCAATDALRPRPAGRPSSEPKNQM